MWQMQRCAKKAREDPKSPYAERKKHDIYDDFKVRVAAMDYSKSVEQMDSHHRAHYENAKPKKLTPLERQPKHDQQQGSKAAVASAAAQQKK